MAESQRQTEARQRWLRVVPQRMQALLKRFELLKQCAGDGYSATQLEEQHIIKVLRSHVDDLDKKFVERRTPKPKAQRPPSPHFAFADMEDMFDEATSRNGTNTPERAASTESTTLSERTGTAECTTSNEGTAEPAKRATASERATSRKSTEASERASTN